MCFVQHINVPLSPHTDYYYASHRTYELPHRHINRNQHHCPMTWPIAWPPLGAVFEWHTQNPYQTPRGTGTGYCMVIHQFIQTIDIHVFECGNIYGLLSMLCCRISVTYNNSLVHAASHTHTCAFVRSECAV